MSKGFVYQSSEDGAPMVAVVFDLEGTVAGAKAVDSVAEGEEFIRATLAELQRIIETINRPS